MHFRFECEPDYRTAVPGDAPTKFEMRTATSEEQTNKVPRLIGD